MGYATESTLWPSSNVPTSVKQLVDQFFSLVDNKNDDAGPRLAQEIFTEDGHFFAASGSFEGTEEISNSRRKVWETVTSRRHQVLKVYANDADGLDLMVAGTVAVKPVEGPENSHQFLARVVMDNTRPETPRMKHYEVLMSGKDSILSTKSRK